MGSSKSRVGARVIFLLLHGLLFTGCLEVEYRSADLQVDVEGIYPDFVDVVRICVADVGVREFGARFSGLYSMVGLPAGDPLDLQINLMSERILNATPIRWSPSCTSFGLPSLYFERDFKLKNTEQCISFKVLPVRLTLFIRGVKPLIHKPCGFCHVVIRFGEKSSVNKGGLIRVTPTLH